MQRLILKRIKKKSEQPIKPLPITQLHLNDMYFSLYIDVGDRYFIEGNNKVYEIVNKIEG
jgi:hypothetical protein